MSTATATNEHQAPAWDDAPDLLGVMDAAEVMGFSHWLVRRAAQAIGAGVQIGQSYVIRREELTAIHAEIMRRKPGRPRNQRVAT
jgi:hypothetical protein